MIACVRTLRRSAAALIGLCLAGGGLAQAQRIASPVAWGRVSGTVFDSLLGAPLGGARVWVRGTAHAAITDGRGRFTIDSAPLGPHVLLFSHLALDSLGLPPFGAAVTIAPDSTPSVALAVPALVTVRRRLCGATPPGSPVATHETGVVFGTITDADADTPLVGAAVAASWLDPGFEAGRFTVRHPVARGRSDAAGRYILCGIPTTSTANLVATLGPAATAVLEITPGSRGLVRRDLRLTRDTLTPADSITGLPRGHAAVAGTVRSGAGAIVHAYAIIENAADQAETDASGRFILAGVPAGSQMLTIRAIGYGAVRMPVELKDGDTLHVAAVQLEHITVLDTLRALGVSSAVLGAAERARSSAGVTLFAGELARHEDLAGALRQLPGVRIQTQAGGVQVMGIGTTGASCLAHIWIDEQRADDLSLNALRPDQVVLLEWYERAFEAPQRYRGQDDCGVLLVWTTANRH